MTTTSNLVTLRDVLDSDLPVFYEQQRDPQAAHMAAFPAREWEAFQSHWTKIRADETNILRAILCNGQVAGNILSFVLDGQREVGYWLGREFWGLGTASRALEMFLSEVNFRPLYGYVVSDNRASRRVLEKRGFQACGSAVEFSVARDAEVEFLIFRLD